MTKETFRLTIEAQANEIPVSIRLRHVLKKLLRWFGFRCLKIEAVSETGQEIVTNAVMQAGEAAPAETAIVAAGQLLSGRN